MINEEDNVELIEDEQTESSTPPAQGRRIIGTMINRIRSKFDNRITGQR